MKSYNMSLWSAFQLFCNENPLEMNEEELDRIKKDILEPREGIVSDESVDFLLWKDGLKSRQQSFAEFIEKRLPMERYPKLLEVGCGRTAKLAKILTKRGYHMTVMDPKAQCEEIEKDHICCIRDFFDWEQAELAGYDAVVAQEPCDATEHIVRACVKQQRSYVIALCGVPHRFLNGENPKDVYSWYQYLQQICGDKCVLLNMELVAGYSSCVLFADYSEV